MNAYETWFCGTRLWSWMTRRQVLPWVLQGSDLGEHVLELGAGAGAATVELARRAPRVTSLEHDHVLAVKLSTRANHSNIRIIQGDAAALPFPDGTFSSAIAILMLHHLKSIDLQDRTFSEVYRVLRRGGVFLAFDIPDGWFHRVGHIKSTFVPLDPATVSQRLMAAGLSKIMMDSRSSGFRIRALRSE